MPDARLPFVAMLLFLVACGDDGALPDGGRGDAGPDAAADTGAPDAGPLDTGMPDAGGTCTAAGPEVVTFLTDDGIRLEADLYTTGEVGGPGAVLLHMVPPFNDRRNYPEDVIARLTGAGLTVLNVDRRGAGGSLGSPADAYEGPNGALDGKAALRFLVDHPCAVDPARLIVIGASNGTTTALDVTVLSASDADVPRPAALVFLTGGTYTENQNRIADQRALLDPIPIQLMWDPMEAGAAEWNAALRDVGSASWTFLEYTPGAHGTGLLTTNPSSVDDIVTFVGGI